jgi:hypothetical protein
MRFGVGLIAARPGLHRLIKSGYRFVPGLQTYLRRFLPAQPAPAASASETGDWYIFKPHLAPNDTSGVVTVEHLYHLSRSL